MASPIPLEAPVIKTQRTELDIVKYNPHFKTHITVVIFKLEITVFN
jgi:hypothetical protein